MPGMDNVKASPQGFRIEELHGTEFMSTNLPPNRHLREERKSQPSFHHPLCGFDRVHFQGYVWNQAGAPKQAMG